MFLGPFVTHRLLSGSRKASTYFTRTLVLCVPFFFIAWIWIDWDLLHRHSYDPVVLSRLGQGLLLTLVVGSAFEMPMLWSLAAIALPQERDRKTLDALLATRLSSFEIILGLLLRIMVTPLESLFAVLPVAAFMFWYWGFDPREWVLLNIGLLSTMLVLVSFGLAGSLSATTINKSTARVLSLTMLWLIGPFAALMAILPRLPTAISTPIRPPMIWALQSSPMGLLAHAAGIIRRGSFLEATFRMIGLEILLALAVLAWAVFRLRAAARAVYDTEGRLARALQLKFSPRKQWPACGDDPIFWRERFAMRVQNRVDRWMGYIIITGLLACIVWSTYYFAKPAIQEVWRYGYYAPKSDRSLTALDLFSEAYLRGMKGPPAPGLARPEFNMAIRILSPMIHLMAVFLAFGLAAESLVTEVKRDTWSGLLVTPLSGRDILRGKTFGVFWRLRHYLILLLALWSIGLVSGAIHPLGFVFSLTGVVTSCLVSIAIGLYIGLYPSVQARQFWALPFVLALMSSLLIFVPFAWGKSIVMGFGSMTFLTFLSLFSFDDVSLGFSTGEFLPIHTYGMRTDGGFVPVLLTCLAGWVAQILVALHFYRAAIRDFDKVAGRPVRSQDGENRATVPLWIKGTA